MNLVWVYLLNICMNTRTSLHEVTLNGQKLNPTKFERDLVRAINGETGYSRFQSRGAEKIAHLAATKLKAKRHGPRGGCVGRRKI